MKLLIKQFVKFSIVGGVSTVIDVGLYFGLTRGFSWWEEHFLVANVISFGLAAINSFVLNKLWTFRDGDKRVVRQYTIFLVVALIGLGISQTFVWGGATYLDSDLIGKLVGVGGTVLWNFTMNRLITFKKRPEQKIDSK